MPGRGLAPDVRPMLVKTGYLQSNAIIHRNSP